MVLVVKLHKKFRKVNKAAGIIRQVVKEGYFRLDDESKIRQLREVAKQLCEAYNVPQVSIIGRPDLLVFKGYYSIVKMEICLSRPSLVTFLHEFRHHLQHNGVDQIGDKEKDAQGWACSVYYRACPNLYKKAVESGRIMGVIEI